MRPAWDGIAGWVLLLVALVLALFVVPYPHNGMAVVALMAAFAGGCLVAISLTRQQKGRRRR